MSSVEGNAEMIEVCKAGFGYLLMIMRVDDDQVFKICIEFFHFYIGGYLESQLQGRFNTSNNSLSLFAIYKDIFL